MTTFAAARVSGDGWISGLGARAQPYWDEHATFMDRLFEQGCIMLGGPYADGSGALIVYEADTPEEADALMKADPFHAAGVFVKWTVRPWKVIFQRN